MAAPLSTVASLVIRVGVDPTGVKAGMAAVNAQVRSGMMATKASAGRMGVLAAHPAVGAAAIAATAITAIGVKMAAGFDQAMTQSLAIMGDVSAEMRTEMENAARAVGRETTFSATQAAESYYFLASAGLDANAQLAAMPRVAAFAQAGMFDMARATDLLTDAQSALGLTVRDDAVANLENMNRVSDVLVKANTLANASVEQFSEALTNGAGAALRSVNKDVEEGVAVLAAYADQGVKGLLAGSSLDRLIRMMPSAALKNADAYEAMGIEVFDSAGNMNHMADIIDDLTNGLDGMSDAEKTAAMEALGFKARVQGLIKPLLGTGKLIRDYSDNLYEAGGITDEVAAKQLESFTNQLKLLMGELKDIALTIGLAVMPVLKSFVGIISAIVKPIGEFVRANEALIKTFAPIIAGLSLILALNFSSRFIAMLLPFPGAAAKVSGAWAKVGAAAVSGFQMAVRAAQGAWAAIGTTAAGVYGAAFTAGLVALAAAAVLLAVRQFFIFKGQVDAAQKQYQAQADAAASFAGSKAVVDLKNYSNVLESELQGVSRMLGDTFGGKQHMDSLLNLTKAIAKDMTLNRDEVVAGIEAMNDAAQVALGRGNREVAAEIDMFRMGMEARLRSMPVEPPDIAGPIEAEMKQAVINVTRGVGNIKAALNQPTQQTISKGDRIENMEARVKRITGKVKQAVEVGDPLAISYWTSALVKQKKMLNGMKTSTVGTMEDVRNAVKTALGGETSPALEEAATAAPKAVEAAQPAMQHAARAQAMAIRQATQQEQASLVTAAAAAAEANPTAITTAQSALDATAAAAAITLPNAVDMKAQVAFDSALNMASMTAGGLYAGVPEVAAAAAALATAAAGPIESHSPPKYGPLKNIDKWGPRLAKTFAGGLAKGAPYVGAASDALGRALSPSPRFSGVAAGGGAQGSSGATGGVHIHVGTLIADDRGLDELERRMAARTRIGNRTRWTDNEFR